MRCPKCHYISFDTSERCRNCGYDFSLADAPAPPPELPIRTDGEPLGPLADLTLNEADAAPGRTNSRGEPARLRASGDLPLFEAGDPALDDRPLVTPAAKPRPPLAVRRATPDLARARARSDRASIQEVPILDLGPGPSMTPAEMDEADEPGAGSSPRPEPAIVTGVAAAAGPWARIIAGIIDLSILGALDAVVIYFTLRLCGLTLDEIRILPLAPLLGFFGVLNGGYFTAFTAGGGQTIGKMAAGIRVVGELGDPVGLGQAVFRTAAYLVSALPFGLGFLPALIGTRRALHDRLAETRVIRA